MKKIFAVFICLITAIVFVKAQDVHFSQQFDNDIYLNPAQSGLGKKANRLVLQYRDQWRSVPVPYSSAFVSYDRKINAGENQLLGAGLQLLYDRAGDGKLSTIKVSVSPSYTRFFKEERIGLSVGFQIGMLHRFIDSDGLVFESQFDGVGVNNPSGEALNGTATAPDLGFGLHLSSKIGDKNHIIETGFSMYNFHEPNLSFIENAIDNRPTRFNVYAKSEVFVGQNGWSINPVLQYQRQENLNNILPLVFAKKYLKNKNMAFSFGGGYRVKDAAKMYFAYEVNDFKIGVNYDINTSAFNDATNSIGAGEILLKYEFERKKTEKIVEIEIDTLLAEDTTEFVEEIEEQVEEEVVVEVDETEVTEEIEETVDKVETVIETPKVSRIDEINAGTNIQLYFPNDYPNPNSLSPTTKTPYGEIYRKYIELSVEYYRLGGNEGNMQDFIDNHVIKEWNKYNQLISEISKLLKEGKTVTLVVKGHTSPLANSDYNLNLSKRRVQSFINQVSFREDLDLYIKNGQLKVTEVFYGETKSDAAVSDDSKNKKQSIYSDKAAFERRVEIEKVIVE
ncbi:MAG: PorP/SprF family type IX secretion system membrane protein [Chitinophagales bacterium]